MTKQLELDRIRDFIRLFQVKYEEESILTDVCNVVVYQERFSEIYSEIGNWTFQGRNGPRGHSDLEYIQLGKRSLTPVEVLNSEQPLLTIKSFVRSLKLGERNYVLSQLDEKAGTGEIETVPFKEPSHENFQKWCGRVQKPDHLFLPLDTDFHNTVFDWRREHDYFFNNMGEAAKSGPNVVQIHWVPLDTDIESGYLVSSEGLKVVRKWFDDSPDPSGFNHDQEYDRFSLNRPLMVYLGENVVDDKEEDTEGFEHKVDFLYRIILSNMMLDEGHAIKLKPTRELSSER